MANRFQLWHNRSLLFSARESCMVHEHLHIWIGLLGDGLTFLGGAILALDAVNQEKEAQRIRKISRTIESPGFKRLLIEVDGATVKGEEDVEAVFLRRSAKIAKRGFIILNIGFLLLIASRLTELCR